MLRIPVVNDRYPSPCRVRVVHNRLDFKGLWRYKDHHNKQFEITAPGSDKPILFELWWCCSRLSAERLYANQSLNHLGPCGVVGDALLAQYDEIPDGDEVRLVQAELLMDSWKEEHPEMAWLARAIRKQYTERLIDAGFDLSSPCPALDPRIAPRRPGT